MEIEVSGVFLVALLVGLSELLKRSGMPKRIVPIATVVLGIAAGIVYVSPDDAKNGVLVGLSIGLAAIGLYSGAKNTIEKK